MRAKCDQCQVVVINGVACHETGCPESWRDPATGKGHKRSCLWCGSEFEPETKGQNFCEDECAWAHNG